MEQFTMSMFANKQDLYKAKSEYYAKKLKELEALLADCHSPASNIKDWVLVDRINTAIAELEEL